MTQLEEIPAALPLALIKEEIDGLSAQVDGQGRARPFFSGHGIRGVEVTALLWKSEAL